MPSELKPCPFCGSDACYLGSFAACSVSQCSLGRAGVVCYEDDWNTRPAESEIQGRLDEAVRLLLRAEEYVNVGGDSEKLSEDLSRFLSPAPTPPSSPARAPNELTNRD